MPPHPSNPRNSGRVSFRCPSCLHVLTVDMRMAGIAGPCPLCTAHIIAPQPMANGIPFATLVGAQPSPFSPAESSANSPKTKTATSASKVVLADGNLDREHAEKKDAAATLRMILFVILTLGVCLVTAFILLQR